VTTEAPVQIPLPPMTAPQMAILTIDERDARCVDVEGSPRSAKSWGIGFWLWKLAYKYPGIHVFYCRYKDDDLKTLREVWGKVSARFPEYVQPTWNTKEEAWDFPNGEWRGEVYSGSRVYLSSLRVAEAMTADAVHGKYKGKTLAVVVVEEAQEVPKIHYDGLKERLSQSVDDFGRPQAYPLAIVLVHNSVNTDHWIAKEFPLTADGRCAKPGHAHIRADLYSNAPNLGAAVMAGYEQDYPPGHPLRRVVIEGKRGLTRAGKPVYEYEFKRPVHVTTRAQFLPHYPLLEGWDFGRQKPAVVWAQYIAHKASFRIIGAVKGSELFLETFAPWVLAIRRRLFPYATEIRTWCDPTGATGNHGLEYTAISSLRDLGVAAQPAKDPGSSKDGNDIEVRDKAIQTIASYMLKQDVDGLPAFMVAPQCVELIRQGDSVIEQESDILVTAFEAGYVWSEKALSDDKPNLQKPQKGTLYDDLMNALEYIVVGERIPIAPTLAQLSMAAAKYQTAPQRAALKDEIQARAALRKQMQDTHPIDAPRRGGRVMMPLRGQRRSFY
jgi:hypothetical protein